MGAPPGYRIVEIDTESAAKLRDIVSYRRDFEAAEQFLGLYVDSGFDPLTADYRVSEDALWIAAVTSYGRAFNTGVRHLEKPSTSVYSADELAAHEYFIHVRDKYVAHSVNEFEQTFVIAYLTDSSFAARAITRVGQQQVSVARLTLAEAEVLRSLCRVQIRDLNTRIRRLHDEIGRELREGGIDAAYAFPDLVVPTVDPDRVGKARKLRKRFTPGLI